MARPIENAEMFLFSGASTLFFCFATSARSKATEYPLNTCRSSSRFTCYAQNNYVLKLIDIGTLLLTGNLMKRQWLAMGHALKIQI